MKVLVSYAISFLFSISDAAICTLLTLASCNWSLLQFSKEFSSFTFSTSTLELFLLPLLRLSIYTGSIIAAVYNPNESLRRCRRLQKLVALFCLLQFYYVILKLLIISDGSYFSVHLKDPLFWTVLGWNALASVVFYYQWSLLTHQRPSNIVLITDHGNRESINTCGQGYQSVQEDNNSSNGVSFRFISEEVIKVNLIFIFYSL